MNFSFSRFIDTLLSIPRTVRFILEHRIWSGFWKYGWVFMILVAGGVIFSYRFYSTFINWWSHLQIHQLGDVGSGVRNLAGDLNKEGGSLLFSSSFKYIIFVLMEVVVFHSVHRTLEILDRTSGKKPTFGAFFTAQIRMFQISIQSWVLELIATIFISIALGMLGFKVLKAPLVFLVQCYFLGFMMIDNYNERLGMNISKSLKFTRGFLGVSLALGLSVYAIIHIPLVGVFIAPLIGGVTATLVMDRLIHPASNENYEYLEY